MKILNKKKLEKRIIALNTLVAIVILFAFSVALSLLYFASEHKMGLVANFLNLTEFELFWYSPFIFGGFFFVFFAVVILILYFRADAKQKLNCIYFYEGKEFLYNENGISFSISKDKNWVVYKNSEFIKDSISIDILSCKIKDKVNGKSQQNI